MEKPGKEGRDEEMRADQQELFCGERTVIWEFDKL